MNFAAKRESILAGKTKLGFLGPRGTFTEEALLSHSELDKENMLPYSSEQEVIYAVNRGEVDKGIVPIENSIEGSVNVTLDILTFEADLLIEGEIVYPIKHHLIGASGLTLDKVSSVVSHPQAAAQCRLFLNRELPNVEILAANSTAEAVKKVAKVGGSKAAIGPKLAAEIYDLSILSEDIADFKENETRFVIVGREEITRTGSDKTSLVCFIYEDRPGSLLQILQEFAGRDINLTKIQSRPTKKGLGDYCFWIDMEGHQDDEGVSGAIDALKEKIRNVKILGSYPRAAKSGD